MQPVIFIRFVFNRFRPFIQPVIFHPVRIQPEDEEDEEDEDEEEEEEEESVDEDMGGT